MLREQNVAGTVKFEGGNVMIWGCMSWSRPGAIAHIVGRMDSEQHIEILDI